MTNPVISDLPSATSLNDDDLLVVRQPGSSIGVDKAVTVGIIRAINLSSLPTLPSVSPVESDLMLVQRSGSNYQTTFNTVGFKKGTRMWFYHDLVSSVSLYGWKLVSTTSDAVLGVKGPNGTVYNTGGSVQGTWQQPDHALSLNEIPAHHHNLQLFETRALSSTSVSSMPGATAIPSFAGIAKTGLTGGGQHQTPGQSQPHNHGDVWRPKAAVGVILEKL